MSAFSHKTVWKTVVFMAAFSTLLMAGVTTHAEADLRFRVNTIHIDGMTVFDPAEVQYLFHDVEGKDLTLLDLEEVALDLMIHYQEAGFPFTYAYLAPQDIDDGAVTITVLEGRYGHVEIQNTSPLRENTVIALLDSVREGEVIETRRLNRALRRLAGIPGITASSTLRPGHGPGTVGFEVNVETERRFSARVTADNYGNDYTGEVRTGLFVEGRIVAGWADRVSLTVMGTGDGLLSGRLGYGLLWPVGDRLFQWDAAYSTTHYELGGPFTPLNAEGTAHAVTVGVQMPTHNPEPLNLNYGLRYDYSRLDERILGASTPRIVHAITISTMGEAALEGAAVNRFSVDLSAGNLTIDEATAQQHDALTAHTAGNYGILSGTFAHQRNFIAGTTLLATVRGQVASRNLHSTKKLSLGGPMAVRAYSNQELSGDDGWLTQVEIHKPLSVNQLQAFVFVDAGGVVINKQPWDSAQLNQKTLYGAGVGVNYAPIDGLNIRAQYGVPLGESRPGQLWMQGSWQF